MLFQTYIKFQKMGDIIWNCNLSTEKYNYLEINLSSRTDGKNWIDLTSYQRVITTDHNRGRWNESAA